MSTLPMDKLPQGAPYAIGAAVVQTLRTAPELVGAVVLDNPRRASDLSEGERIVFFEDQSDRQRDNPAQVQHRTYSFAVGVVNRSTNARQAAHADYRAAKRAIRAAITAMAQGGVNVRGQVRETNVSFQLENIDVGGCLVLGTFAVEYRDLNGF